MKSQKILISGYYGFDNFGDDAILQVLLNDINNYIENPDITVISNDPAKILKNYYTKSVYKFNFKEIIVQMLRSDLFISGGGSLLQDVTSFKSLVYYLGLIYLAKILRKKVCIYAQGIGPIKNKIAQFLSAFILKKCDLITVRDSESQNFLKTFNITSIKTTDPVWNISEPKDTLQKDKINIGIQLRSWYSLDDDRLKLLAHAVSSKFCSPEYVILLISLQDSHDLKIIQKFEVFLKEINPDININLISGLSIDKNINLIKKLDYFIAMRYHAVLISIKFNIPTLALSYDPKVESLAKESEIPFIKIESFNEKLLIEKIQELFNESYNLKNKLQLFSRKKESEARQNIYLLVKMLEKGESLRMDKIERVNSK